MGTEIDFPGIVDAVAALARRAGDAILDVAVNFGKVERKGDGSPVTIADRKSHDIIIQGLGAIAPGIPIVSEEGDLADLHQYAGRPFFLVDPLDGTKEFIRGYGDYTVNIAFIENGKPLLGVIHAPALRATYKAVEGRGAFFLDSGGEAPIRATGTEDPVVAVVSRSHPSPETDEFLARYPVTRRIERGSSIKMCAVAEGRADLYVRLAPTFLWDTAAGTIIVREAGGKVSTPAGKPLTYPLNGDLRIPGFIVHTPETVTFPEGSSVR